MDAKLKALKVPALKAILAQHGLSTTGNKPDLIARILADPAALASATGEPSAPSIDDDLLAPPAEFDWDNTSTSAPADTAVKPKSPTKATVALPKPPSAKAAIRRGPTRREEGKSGRRRVEL
ncbi:hypothetical protein BOTBODRAFT_195302 [Botryobasidium botryosum FD-172 SS1]|uniref:SAP domain-containing protein n=1 Tax=Botryobasidium botryosum (strain FD-172 SS1) TaxID=930990 RepID=A0A067NAQ0_BOTB1|nr:hypothetical protein BOTBODRAFT_195302 [Botryobasidium botryosum FD-172 SS1]